MDTKLSNPTSPKKPKYLHVETTTRCVLACPACPRTTWREITGRPAVKHDLDVDLLERFLDCDGDNDLDLFFVVSSVLIDGSITQTWGWLENTGFQHPASLEGDLNGDGDVDSADLGRLLGGFTG